MNNLKRVVSECLLVMVIMLILSVGVGLTVKAETIGVAMLLALLLIPSIAFYSALRLSQNQKLKYLVFGAQSILYGGVFLMSWLFPTNEVNEAPGLAELILSMSMALNILCFIVICFLDEKWKNQELSQSKFDNERERLIRSNSIHRKSE